MPWATPHLNTQQVQVSCDFFSISRLRGGSAKRRTVGFANLPLSFGGFWMIFGGFWMILDDFGHANLWNKLHIDVENYKRGQQLEPNMIHPRSPRSQRSPEKVQDTPNHTPNTGSIGMLVFLSHIGFPYCKHVPTK